MKLDKFININNESFDYQDNDNDINKNKEDKDIFKANNINIGVDLGKCANKSIQETPSHEAETEVEIRNNFKELLSSYDEELHDLDEIEKMISKLRV